MPRRSIIWLWIFMLPLSLFAQSEEGDSIAYDSIGSRHTQRSFKRSIKQFLNFSDFDTTYISPNRYNYALMLDHFTNYEYYSISNSLPTYQHIKFSPNPHNKIGVYFGWRWIFLGWSIDTDGIYGKKNGKTKGTEFDLSLYSSKLGVDIAYRHTGNNYRINEISGFPGIPKDFSADFSGLKVNMKGINLYYPLAELIH